MDIIYHTLLGLYRDDDGCFFFDILFGDYDEDIVKAEFDAYRHDSTYELYRLIIIDTDDDQDAIDAQVDALNEEYFYLNQAVKSSH